MTLKNNIEQWLRLECSVPLCLLTWDHSTWGRWAHPVGWFTGGLGKGVTDLWGPWRGLKEARAGFGKNTALGASAQEVLCPFCAMKGRKWGRSASQGSEPTLTPCVSSGREKEILRRGETMLEAGFQQGMLSFIQIIFFKLVRRRGCAFYTPVKDPPALYASHFSPLTVQCGSEF